MRKAEEYLRAKFFGCRLWRQNQGMKGHVRFTSENGLPDFVGVQKYGQGLFCEVKASGGKLTPLQYVFLQDMHERGCAAGVYVPEGFFYFDAIPSKYMPTNAK